jgi:DNA-binding CsgD family transcriptional regulator/ArsR family metal-binding transcriptional regulator
MSNLCFPISYSQVSVCAGGPSAKPGSTSQGSFFAVGSLNYNITPLFPYINASVASAELYENPAHLKLKYKDFLGVIYPDRIMLSPINDKQQAISLLEQLKSLLEDIRNRRDSIPPKNRVFKRIPILEIYKHLPRKNCKECGYSSCLAFAAAVSSQQIVLHRCLYMIPPISEKAVYTVYDQSEDCEKTITFDIDTTQTLREFEGKNSYIRQLENKISKLQQPKKTVSVVLSDDCLNTLTDRETEVLRLVSTGATNNEISKNLNITSHTVKSHILHIFNKLGVNDRTQAAVWAVRKNIV